jgi:hypothetical protein
MVRARVLEDLLRFCKALKLEPHVLEINRADYRYRMKVSKGDWATYLQVTAMELDYPNFKEAGTKDDRELRREAYEACWSELLRWQVLVAVTNRMTENAGDLDWYDDQ